MEIRPWHIVVTLFVVVFIVVIAFGTPIGQRVVSQLITGNYVQSGGDMGTMDLEVRSNGAMQVYIDNVVDVTYCTADPDMKSRLQAIYDQHEDDHLIPVVSVRYVEPTVNTDEWAKCTAEAREGSSVLRLVSVRYLGYSALVIPATQSPQ